MDRSIKIVDRFFRRKNKWQREIINKFVRFRKSLNSVLNLALQTDSICLFFLNLFDFPSLSSLLFLPPVFRGKNILALVIIVIINVFITSGTAEKYMLEDESIKINKISFISLLLICVRNPNALYYVNVADVLKKRESSKTVLFQRKTFEQI